MKNAVRKLRSKSYPTIIEVTVPTRFYWTDEGFDGLEFGPLEECSKYQLHLLSLILDTLTIAADSTKVVRYLQDNDPTLLKSILDRLSSGIPETFLKAFDKEE